MGAKFTASEQALAPVLRETAKRGLIYVDDGSSPRSIAAQLAGSNNVPFAKTDIVLDTVPTPNRDRARAGAAGNDGARPRPGDRLRQRAAGLDRHASRPGRRRWKSRGFVLVPITMVAVKAKST